MTRHIQIVYSLRVHVLFVLCHTTEKQNKWKKGEYTKCEWKMSSTPLVPPIGENVYKIGPSVGPQNVYKYSNKQANKQINEQTDICKIMLYRRDDWNGTARIFLAVKLFRHSLPISTQLQTHFVLWPIQMFICSSSVIGAYRIEYIPSKSFKSIINSTNKLCLQIMHF